MRVVVAIAVFLLATPARSLDFDAAIGLAPNQPQLAGLQAAQQLRRELDATLPTLSGNPEVALGPGVGVGPAGSGPALQLALAQSWNLGGLPAARRQAAAAERAALAAQWRAQHLQARLAAARAWLQTAEAQALLLAAEAELDLAKQLQQLSQKAAARGVVTAADAAEAAAFAGEVELRAVFYEGEVHDRSADLARLCALPPEPLPEASGAPPTVLLPSAAAWRELVARAGELPAAAQRQLQAQAEAARATETRALHASSLQVGVAATRDSQGELQAFATLGLRWSLFDSGQRVAAVAAEQQAHATGEAAQARHDAAHLLAQAWHEVEHSREREAVLRVTIHPAVVELVRLREQAFQRGAATVFEVLRARRERSEAFRRLTEATTDRLWAEIQAWLLAAALEQAAPTTGKGAP